MYLHVSLRLIHINLVCNMNTFREENVLTPSQGSRMCVYTGKIFASILLHASFPLILYAT